MAIFRFYLAAFGGMRDISETFLAQVSIIRFYTTFVAYFI